MTSYKHGLTCPVPTVYSATTIPVDKPQYIRRPLGAILARVIGGSYGIAITLSEWKASSLATEALVLHSLSARYTASRRNYSVFFTFFFERLHIGYITM